MTKSEFRLRLSNWSPDPARVLAVNSLFSQWIQNLSGTWAAFSAMRSEIKIDSFYSSAGMSSSGSSLRWAFPRVDGETMRFLIPGAGGFEKSALGFSQPVSAGAQEISRDELDGAIIPGVAFDIQGVRLGRGRGFYDRYFGNFLKQKVGVAVADQVYNQIPSEPHDLKVNKLITDCGILSF